MVMRGRPGGHRSGAGSSGAGSNKCTEVANGKHNTKIDKFLEEEQQKADECLNTHNVNECPKPQDTPGARAETGPRDPNLENEDDEDESEDENVEEDTNEDSTEDPEDQVEETAKETKKKGQTH